MKLTSRRLLATAIATLLAAPLLGVSPASADDPVVLNLIGINDFHGRIDDNTVKWAGTVEQLRQEGGDVNTVMVSAGDNVSASLFASAVQGDIPTIDVLNALELDASAVGNHEFDKGYEDLITRLQPAADFPFLGANVRKKADSSRALPAYDIVDAAGLKVAVIGAVTQETPTLVSPAGVADLAFGDPSDSINEAVAELDGLPEAEQPDVIVASYHEGAPDGTQTFPQAMASSMVFQRLVNNTSAEVDAIFMGHTHQKYAYDAPIPGNASKTRPIIQTGNYGENVGQIKLSVDPANGAVTSYTAQNVARTTTADGDLTTTFPRVATVKPIVDEAIAFAAEVGNEPKGKITADITTAYTSGGARDDRASESTLGNLVADALLSKVAETEAGADIGIVNPGGLRADLLFAGDTTSNPANTDGVVTYAEANAVLPFVNNLNSVTVSGATLKEILEQQWQRDAAGNVPSRDYLQLGLSKNVAYVYDAKAPEGDRIISVTINGAPLDPEGTYKIATFSFLATGGDNFRAFLDGETVDTGLVDYEAWIEYLEANVTAGLAPDYQRRSIAADGATKVPAGPTASVKLSKLDLTSLGVPATTSVSGAYTIGGGASVPFGPITPANGSVTVPLEVADDFRGAGSLEFTTTPTGTSATVPLTVSSGPSTTTATAPARAKVGTTFAVDAEVTGTGSDTPTGTVTVSSGDVELASADLENGAAALTINASALTVDDHTLTVAYSGDDHNLASTDEIDIEITKGKAGLGATVGPITYGTSGKVVVSGDPSASGIIYVTKGGTLIGLGFMKSGSATVALGKTALKPGSHELDVFFAGDEKFDGTNTSVTATVAKASAKVSKSSVTKKIKAKKTKATLKVKVSATGFAPTGKVKVYYGSKVYGSANVKGGVAKIKLKKFTSKGTKKLTVKYAGSSYAKPATAKISVKVKK